MSSFDVTVQHMGQGVVRVGLHGALDLAYAYRFDDTLRHVERDAERCLILDLRALDFLDSTGLSRLIAARRRARRTGRRLVLVRGPLAIQRLFSMVALSEHFETVADPGEVVVPAAPPAAPVGGYTPPSAAG